ncbi:MAG TPA: S8 family serine peptidase, partial [Acidobacteriota bacterium]|nr:S8 family serine peptidase [Acidobacteriota bacterium]
MSGRKSVFGKADILLLIGLLALCLYPAVAKAGDDPCGRDVTGFAMPSAVQQNVIASQSQNGDLAGEVSGQGRQENGQPDMRIHLGKESFDPVRDAVPRSPIFSPRPEYGIGAGERHYYIAQFDGPITADMRARLLDSGAEIVAYIPNNAYLVRGKSTLLASGLNYLRWVGVYEPQFKVAPGLMEKAEKISRGESSGDKPEVELRIWAFRGEDIRLIASRLESGFRSGFSGDLDDGALFNGKQTESVVRYTIPADELPAFLNEAAGEEGVYFIEEAYENILHLDNAIRIHQNQQDAVPGTSATIWLRGLMGEGQIYSGNDSGLDVGGCNYKHSSSTTYTSGTCGAAGAPPSQLCQDVKPSGSGSGPLSLLTTQRKVIAYNRPNVNTKPGMGNYGSLRWDPAGHGTGTTGCAVGDNYANLFVEPSTLGYDMYDGSAPLAKAIFQDIGGSSTTAVYPNDNLYALIAQSFDAGAHVNNNSWGGGEDSYAMDSAQIDAVLWDYKDRVVTWSAGNEGSAASTLGTQANSKNAIVVGGNQSTYANRNNMYTSSSRGPTGDGRVKPDIVASASGLTMPYYSDNDVTDTDCSSSTGIAGTSFSAPIVAGYSLLVREYFTKGYYPSGTRFGSASFTPSGALIKGMLLCGAENMTGTSPAGDAPNNNQGFGRLLVEGSLYFSGDAMHTRAWDVSETESVGTGEVWERKINVTSGTALKVLLNWYDPPAVAGATVTLVNNLNLEVIGPTGTVYHGNIFPADDGSGTTVRDSTANPSAWDTLNNVELVRLTAPSTGNYTIRVHGFNVPGHGDEVGTPRQPFAVVATGNINLNAGIVSPRKPNFVCGDDVAVDLYDENASSPTVTVTTQNGDSETISLTGTAPNFSGSLPVAFNIPISTGDGTLQVGAGETLLFTYSDASPSATLTATATVDCQPRFVFDKAEMTDGADAGTTIGCDGDIYLDAGEADMLTVTFKNDKSYNLTGVTAKLVSNNANIFVGDPDTVAVGSVNANSTGTASFPVTGKTLSFGTASMTLLITADGMQEAQELDFDLRVETDLNSYPGTWTYNWESGWTLGTHYFTCANANSATPDGWFLVHGTGDMDCSTWTTAWQRVNGTCVPSSGGTYAFKTYACGTMYPNSSGIKYTRAISPDITTGPAGSWTVLNSLTYVGDLDIAAGGCNNNATYALLFVNSLDSYNGYFISNYGVAGGVDFGGPNYTDTIDFSAWDFERDPGLADDPLTTVSLWFQFDIEPRATGACTTGADYGWELDNLVLSYTNYRYEADDTASCISCSAPPAPTGLTAASPAANTVELNWNASAGAHHYNIFRAGTGLANGTCAGPFTLVATVFGTTTFTETVSAGFQYAYQVTAADSTDICVSGASNCVTVTPSGACTFAPNAVTGLTVTDSPNSGACRLSLSWNASAVVCAGHSLAYNIYRSTSSSFTPSPATLFQSGLATTTYNDTSVVSGYNASNEPAGPAYYYVVRAIDTTNGVEEGNTTIAGRRATGGTTAGTWTDSAGDGGTLVKMVPLSRCGGPIDWTTSTLQNHTTGGSASYRSVPEGSGNNSAALYSPYNCSALLTPPIKTGGSTPGLSFWARYDLESTWDGVVVEARKCADDDCTSGTWSDTAVTITYPSTFSSTVVGDCEGSSLCSDVFPYPSGDGNDYINDCDYPASHGCFSGSVTSWTNYTATLPTTYQNSTIQIRFNLSSDCGSELAGFYLDDISVSGALLNISCTQACPNAPTFYGLFSAVDISAVNGNGITLQWPAISSWGSGSTGVYKVYRDDIWVADVPAGTTTYVDNPPDNIQYTYNVKAVSDCGAVDANGQFRTATDAASGGCTNPSTPVISGITDDNACAQSGITITFTPGSPATSSSLWVDGSEVATGISSPFPYNPGDTSSHNYVVRTYNDTCYTDSIASAFSDANNTPATP